MSSPKLDAFYAEMLEHYKIVSPPPEGLEEFQRLSFGQEALDEISGEKADLRRRLEMLNVAISTVSALASDGYPALPIEQVSAEVSVEMDDMIRVLLAARARFTQITPTPPVMLNVPVNARGTVEVEEEDL